MDRDMMHATLAPHARPRRDTAPLRLGFLGVGWIGAHRLEAVAREDLVRIAAIADVVPGRAEQVAAGCRGTVALESFEALLEQDLDAVVIATPSAGHAEQSLAALERGLAVFCQKPLGRNAEETGAVVEEARRRDRLLGVDLCYRTVAGMGDLRRLVRDGSLGRLVGIDAVFHNAYGPDKPWFYDAARSGGGCVMDLGIHLVDLAAWLLDFPRARVVSSRLFARGERLQGRRDVVEDYALAELDLGGVPVRIACSWNLAVGRDAEIGLTVHGSRGGAALRNLDGSFYDFTVERFRGTAREVLAQPPDAWGGRAIVDWTRRLVEGEGFDPASGHLVQVAALLDGIYGAEGTSLR
jgi:predicted dehydrogenase